MLCWTSRLSHLRLPAGCCWLVCSVVADDATTDRPTSEVTHTRVQSTNLQPSAGTEVSRDSTALAWLYPHTIVLVSLSRYGGGYAGDLFFYVHVSMYVHVHVHVMFGSSPTFLLSSCMPVPQCQCQCMSCPLVFMHASDSASASSACMLTHDPAPLTRDRDRRRLMVAPLALVAMLAATGRAAQAFCAVTTESLLKKLAPCSLARANASLPVLGGDSWRETDRWSLHVDDTAAGARQSILGFGAAWTDATVRVFDSLDAAIQQSVLQKLFSPTDGISLSLVRHTIGQSDLTPPDLGRWSFDDNGGRPDPSLRAFDLTDPGRKMLGWLQRMLAVSPDIKLFGSPWSPPGWMKTEDNTLRPEYVDAWVSYMLGYVRAYAAGGVAVHALTPQNEPLHSADPAWTTYLNASTQGMLVGRLGAALRNASLPTQVWAYDHNTDRADVPQHILEVAGEYVGAVAWHCYSGGPANASTWSPMSEFAKANPGVSQVMTECWTHLQTGEGFFDLPDFVGGPVRAVYPPRVPATRTRHMYMHMCMYMCPPCKRRGRCATTAQARSPGRSAARSGTTSRTLAAARHAPASCKSTWAPGPPSSRRTTTRSATSRRSCLAALCTTAPQAATSTPMAPVCRRRRSSGRAAIEWS